MQQRLSWKIYIPSTSHEIPCIWWNLIVHYHVHKSPTMVSILSQMNSVNTLHPASLCPTLILSFHQHLGLPSCFFPSGVPTKSIGISLLSHVHHMLHLSHLVSICSTVLYFFHQMFPPKSFSFHLPPICTTCSTHLIPFNLIITQHDSVTAHSRKHI